jgi:hypothetical protein
MVAQNAHPGFRHCRVTLSIGMIFLVLSAAFAGPKIRFFENTFDFGALAQGDVVTHAFPFENGGDAALVILKVAPSCGCTIGRLSKDTLLPKEKGSLEVTFNTDRFTGKQNKSITVSCNDPSQPSFQLYFTADVSKIFDLKPEYIVFNSNLDGLSTRETEVPFDLVNTGLSTLNYIDIKALQVDLLFDKTFPLTAACKKGDSLRVIIRPVIKNKIAYTLHGFLEIKLGYADGKKMEKKIGVAIKKWRPEESSKN